MCIFFIYKLSELAVSTEYHQISGLRAAVIGTEEPSDQDSYFLPPSAIILLLFSALLYPLSLSTSADWFSPFAYHGPSIIMEAPKQVLVPQDYTVHIWDSS